MERITKSDLIDKFIECSALTPSDVGGGLGTRWGAGYRVGGVGKRDFCCFFLLLLLLLCVLMLLAVYGQTLKQFDYFIVYFIDARKPLLTYHFDSFKPLLTYQLLF